PMMSTFDPWRRDGGDGYQAGALDPGTFYEQGDCGCSLELPKPKPVRIVLTGSFPNLTVERRISDDTLDDMASNILADHQFGTRFTPVTTISGSTAFRVTELLWTSRVESFFVRTGDEVHGATYSGS